uniref:MYND-type domain-containing protein n=1 Tax=Picocystis salinarum TaxID=88271 RepID=A0A6U9R6J4_9CHLO
MDRGVMLGFPVEMERDGVHATAGEENDTRRNPFLSRTGGAPAWSTPRHLPHARPCPTCGGIMKFLLQIYAPWDEKQETFHRNIYLFTCVRATCLKQTKDPKKTKNIAAVAYRNQLPRNNPYHAQDACQQAKHRYRGIVDETCEWCNAWIGNKTCGGCKTKKYCSKQHQIEHWRHGHKHRCKDGKQRHDPNTSTDAFPHWNEWELVVEPEDEQVDEGTGRGDGPRSTSHPSNDDEEQEDDSPAPKKPNGNESTHLKRLVAAYEGKKLDGRGTDEAITAEDVNSIEISREHRHLADVQARMALAPDQCVRYCRGREEEILWMGLHGKIRADDVPRCARCGGKRRFEFQVMPQMLSYLGVDDDQEDATDWGTLVVYTCENSCDASKVPGDPASSMEHAAYVEEFVWIQPPV